MENDMSQQDDLKNDRSKSATDLQNNSKAAGQGSNTVKDPDEWTTGDEPMTGAQRSYLRTLSDEAKEEVNENLSKAEASKRINELQQKTGRGNNLTDK